MIHYLFISLAKFVRNQLLILHGETLEQLSPAFIHQIVPWFIPLQLCYLRQSGSFSVQPFSGCISYELYIDSYTVLVQLQNLSFKAINIRSDNKIYKSLMIFNDRKAFSNVIWFNHLCKHATITCMHYHGKTAIWSDGSSSVQELGSGCGTRIWLRSTNKYLGL